MPVHGTNPIPSPPPPRPTSNNISFLLNHPPPTHPLTHCSKWTPYVYHHLEKINNSFLRFKSCVDTNGLETWKAILAQYLKLSTVLEKL